MNLRFHVTGPAPTEPLEIAASWHADPLVIVPLLLAGWGYLEMARSVNARHPDNRWPRRRSAFWLGGLVAIFLALQSPIDALSDQLLTVHMVQHALLTFVAPPLLAASGIGTLLLRASSPRVRTRFLLPIMHGPLAVVLHPVVGWVAFAAVMWGSHMSGLYNLALTDPTVHTFEHLLYLGAACLFWWPIFSPDPLRWRLHPGARLGLVFGQLPSMSFLAVVLLTAPAVLYPAYIGRAELYGIDPLVDQQAAGALMWVMGDMALIGAGLIIAAEWMRRSEREDARVDARLARSRERGSS
jgi:cytochrome c oxidase assembly factor CtaG